jgi:hypothetical protein
LLLEAVSAQGLSNIPKSEAAEPLGTTSMEAAEPLQTTKSKSYSSNQST